MNKIQIEIIKTKKRLQLTSGQKLRHYKFTFVPLFIFCIFMINSINSNKLFFHGLYGLELWFWLLISLLIFIKQYKKLSFKEYISKISEPNVKDAFTRSLNELDGSIEIENDLFFQAIIKDPFNMSDDDLMTIIILENSFLVNSIADPRKNSFTFSAPRNKKNIKTFLKHLRDVLDGVPENKEYLLPEKEWTTKRIITRLILYPFFIFVTVMSLLLIIEPVHYRSIPAGIGGLVFGIGYIIVDIILIVRRNKYNAQQKNKK